MHKINDCVLMCFCLASIIQSYNETSVQEFRGSLRGILFEPHDKGYDDARKVYNGMINKHPRMISQCADVADVIRSVKVKIPGPVHRHNLSCSFKKMRNEDGKSDSWI